ncbi:MAG: diguanylate cyclase domain-containing protein [Gammaproteobacteria bacterium]
MEKEWFKAKGQQYDLSLSYINLDYFKNFNNLFGTLKGDDCIKNISKLIKETIENTHPECILARLTGATFSRASSKL